MNRILITCVFALFLLVDTAIYAKVRILTFHCNQTEFIEMQCKTLKKFLLDDYELIVFNDAKTETMAGEIEKTCHKYQVSCVRFTPEWHYTDPLNSYLRKRLQEPTIQGWWGWNAETSNEEIADHPSVRHCHVIQYALDNYGYDHDDVIVIMDGDNFLIKPISFRGMLNVQDMVCFNQWPDEMAKQRIQGNPCVEKGMEMPWVVFIAFNPSKIPNKREMRLNVDVVTGHTHLPQNTISDTGAAIYKYLWKYPEIQLQAYAWQSSYTYRNFSYAEQKNIGLSDSLIRFNQGISPENVQFFFFEHFMHFSAGSVESANRQHKVIQVGKFLDELVGGN